MTDPVLQLAPTSLTIAPGGQARTTLVVENIGSRVEEFRLELLGAAAAWASAEPETLEVYPGAQGQAVLAFSVPPVGTVPSGSFPFGVRAVSLVDHYSADVAEGSVQIGPVSGLAPSLAPVTSSGRWKGRHALTISNWGNTPATVRLVARDPDERLGFLVRPDELDLPLGATRVARVTVRTRRPSLRAAQQRLPFTVVGEPIDTAGTPPGARPPEGGQPVVDGAFLQRPILSRGFVAAVLLVALLCAAALALLLRGGEQAPPELRTGFPLPPPAEFAAAAQGSSALRLTWRPEPSAVQYRIVEVDPENRTTSIDILEPVAGELGSLEVSELAPLSRHCFTIASVNGSEAAGPPSEAVCEQTALPTGTGDLPGPAQWIAVRAVFVTLGNPSAEDLARASRAQLAAAEAVSPGLLDSGAYPQVQPATRGRAWVAYEGPFDRQADAEAVCTVKRCKAVLAGPRQDPAAPPAPPAPPAAPATAPVPPASPAPTPTTDPSAGPAATSGASTSPGTTEPSPAP